MKIIDILAQYFSLNSYITDDNFENVLKQITLLIELGADVNAMDEVGLTPLHIAVNYSMDKVVYKLLEAGANINTQESILGFTPLHYAVKSGSKEIMCMLLCYGADVYITNCLGMTPLMLAIKADLSEMAYILIDYYDDFSHMDEDGFTALSLAARTQNPFAIDLVLAGADVNCSDDLICSPIPYSLIYESAELFRLIWDKVDCKVLLKMEIPFLFIFLHDCQFSPGEWLQCIYLILESKSATLLIEQALSFGHPSPSVKFALFANLVHSFHKKGIPRADRTKIIYACLTLGAEVDFNDIITTYNLYGVGEELEAFKYTYNYCGTSLYANFLLPTFIFVLESGYSRCKIFASIEKELIYFLRRHQNVINRINVVNALSYFALSNCYKNKLIRKVREVFPESDRNCKKLVNKIKSVPKVPSLVELGRNQIRKYITATHNFKKPYEFYDMINNLHIPQTIKDIVILKTPIYRSDTVIEKLPDEAKLCNIDQGFREIMEIYF